MAASDHSTRPFLTTCLFGGCARKNVLNGRPQFQRDRLGQGRLHRLRESRPVRFGAADTKPIGGLGLVEFLIFHDGSDLTHELSMFLGGS
jgi:hypothetical protein